jgi:hypothetical protein
MNSNTEQPKILQENIKTILRGLLREELSLLKIELIEHLTIINQPLSQKENYLPNNLLRPCEAAPLLNITTRTLARWRKKGSIPSTLIKGHYFYKFKDIQAIIESQPSLDYTFPKGETKNPKPGRPSLLKTMMN